MSFNFERVVDVLNAVASLSEVLSNDIYNMPVEYTPRPDGKFNVWMLLPPSFDMIVDAMANNDEDVIATLVAQNNKLAFVYDQHNKTFDVRQFKWYLLDVMDKGEYV